jgi:hypothetical protein
MPKATAVWLVENTTLTFEQISEFCGMHPLEIQGIADGDVAQGIVGQDPIGNGQLTREEIKRCEADPEARLQLVVKEIPMPVPRAKGARYTPVAKRQDKPSAIAWLLRHHSELTDAQVGRLLGTTKATILKIRTRTHWDMANIKPSSPVMLGLCSQEQLDDAIDKAVRVAERRRKETERAQRRAERDKEAAATAAAAAKTETPTPSDTAAN